MNWYTFVEKVYRKTEKGTIEEKKGQELKTMEVQIKYWELVHIEIFHLF